MRHLISATVILVASTGVALAADPYTRPPPYSRLPDVAPLRTLQGWSGFYAGVNGGGGWADARSDFSAAGSPVFATTKNPLAGGLFGAQAGYNWQSGLMVLGAETDFQYANLKGSLDAPPCPAAACGVPLSASFSQKVPWFGTVRGRIGVATDGWLAYATVGYAYARLDTVATATAGQRNAIGMGRRRRYRGCAPQQMERQTGISSSGSWNQERDLCLRGCSYGQRQHPAQPESGPGGGQLPVLAAGLAF